MADALIWLRAEWDRILGVVLVVLGAVVLLLGYWGVAHARYTLDGLAYVVSGGMGGLFLLGIGATLLLCADLHDEWRKFDRIEAAILRTAGPAPGPGPGEVESATGPARDTAGFAGALVSQNGRPGRLAGGVLCLAASVLAAAWVVTARASSTEHAVAGAALGGAALLLFAAGAAVRTSLLRRTVHRRMVGLLGPVLVAAAASDKPR